MDFLKSSVAPGAPRSPIGRLTCPISVGHASHGLLSAAQRNFSESPSSPISLYIRKSSYKISSNDFKHFSIGIYSSVGIFIQPKLSPHLNSYTNINFVRFRFCTSPAPGGQVFLWRPFKHVGPWARYFRALVPLRV